MSVRMLFGISLVLTLSLIAVAASRLPLDQVHAWSLLTPNFTMATLDWQPTPFLAPVPHPSHLTFSLPSGSTRIYTYP